MIYGNLQVLYIGYMRVHRRNTQWPKGNKNEMHHFCSNISFLQLRRSRLADTFKSAQRHKCHTCMCNTHMCVCHIHPYVHSRPLRPRSFWSAPRIATSGQVQRHSSFELICKHNRLRPELIRFVRLDSEHVQSDGKSVNRWLPVLNLARGRDSWCWPKGSQPLERECNTSYVRHTHTQSNTSADMIWCGVALSKNANYDDCTQDLVRTNVS